MRRQRLSTARMIEGEATIQMRNLTFSGLHFDPVGDVEIQKVALTSAASNPLVRAYRTPRARAVCPLAVWLRASAGR